MQFATTCMYSSSRSSGRFTAWCMSLAATSTSIASDKGSPLASQALMYFCTPLNIFTARAELSSPSLSSDVGITSCRTRATNW